MADRRILVELGIIGLFSYFLFFVSTNVNPVLGGIYQGLALLGIILVIVDVAYGKKSFFMINEKISWIKAFIISGVAFVVLLLVSNLASGLAKIIPLTELLQLLGATAPIFSTSETINFIIFAIVIPVVESYVIFCVSIDLFTSIFKIPARPENILSTKLILLMIAISLAFLFFHINAKGIANESALILVAIMAFISVLLVILYQEFRIAILFHVIANTVSLIAVTNPEIFSSILSISLPIT